MPFDFKALMEHPSFQLGLAALGSQNPGMLNAYQALQAQKKAKLEEQQRQQEQELQKAQLEQTRIRNEFYGKQVAGQLADNERKKSETENFNRALEAAIQQMTGRRQPGMGAPAAPQGGVAGPTMQPGAAAPPPMQPPEPVGKYGTPLRELKNLMMTESSGNPNAIHPLLPEGDRAIGPFGFRIGTINMLRKEGIVFNPLDIAQSQDAADYYIQKLTRENGGDRAKAYAAYGGFKTKDPTKYVTGIMGSPEKQVQQFAQHQAQGQQQQHAQQLASTLEPEIETEISVTPEGGRIAFKPSHERNRMLQSDRQHQDNLRQRQEAETRRQQEYADAPVQAQKTEQAKLLVKEYSEIEADARKAVGKKSQVEMLGRFLDNVDTGKLAPAAMEGRLWLKSLGVTVDPSATDAQVADMASKRLAMELKEFSPGQITEWEQKQFQAITPGLGRDPRTNRIMIKAMQRAEERKIAAAKIYREHMRGNKGLLDPSVRDKVSAYIEANPLFDKADLEAPKPAAAAPGSSQGPARIKDDAGYNALPKGAQFIGPDGVLRRKP